MHLPRLSRTLLALTAFMPQLACADDIHVFIDRDELHYFGKVASDGVKKLDALYKAAVTKPKLLSIRSGGGDAGQGIEMGRWVKAQGLDVKVMEYCLSSCANYVFTAGKNKKVSNFAVVGFHGGASNETGSGPIALSPETLSVFDAMPPTEREKQVASMKHFVTETFQAEAAFFREIGVRQEIVRLGQAEIYSKRYGADEKMWGWVYSIDSFAKLGVKDITVINGPWKPRWPTDKYTVFPITVR